MAAGLIGCAIAHVMGTEIPYAIYGIVASLIVFTIAYMTIKPKSSQTQTQPKPESASREDVAATD
jgi:SSS family solute:Na+ symporter